MFLRNVSRILAILAPVVLAAAQDGAIYGPLSGFAFDGATRTLRPIVGVPGAAYLGAPLAASLDFASISPNGALALVESQARLFLLRRLQTGRPVWLLLDASGRTDRVAWSPDSTAAAVYSAATGRLRLWTGLNGAPPAPVAQLSPRLALRGVRPGAESLPPRVDLAELAPLGGTVSALAVDSTGEVLVGITGEASGGLYRVSPGRPPALLAAMAQPSGIALLDSGDLLIADRGRQEILKVRSYRGQPDVSLFAGPGHGLRDPVALAVLPQSRVLVVAGAAERQLSWFDLDTGLLTASVDLDFQPSRLAPSGAESVFLLNARTAAADTLHLLAAGAEPAVYFVPAAGLNLEAVED